MSGFIHNVHERHEQRREARHERREERWEDKHGDHDEHDRRHHNQQTTNYQGSPAPQTQGGYQGQGGYQSQGGYQAPPGPPPSARGPQHDRDFDRDDFTSDTDFNKMMAAGAFNEASRGEREPQRGEYGRYDAPPGPPRGRPHERDTYGSSDRQQYGPPSGAPPSYGQQGQGRGQYGQESRDQYGSGASSNYGQQTQGRGQESRDQYGVSSGASSNHGQQTQGRGQYGGIDDKKKDNTPSGGFLASGGYGATSGEEDRYGSSRGAEDRYGSSRGEEDRYGASRGEGKYGGPNERRGGEPPRKGEADSYYNSQGQSGRGSNPYTHLAGMAQDHGEGDDDHDVYHQATQGLHERIQSRPQGSDRAPDFKGHADAHRKAYGDDDSHGPLDADTIGAAAAMEAIKQTAAAGGKPAGGFMGGAPSGGHPSRPQAEEEEEDTEAPRGSGGGLQDKIMALAMSQAGKLFDKKNGGGASASGDKAQGKAQAMQSAAATAMQLFAQYQTKGKLEATDMQKVMGLAMNLM